MWHHEHKESVNNKRVYSYIPDYFPDLSCQWALMSLTQAGSRVSCVGSVKMDLQFQFSVLSFEVWRLVCIASVFLVEKSYLTSEPLVSIFCRGLDIEIEYCFRSHFEYSLSVRWCEKRKRQREESSDKMYEVRLRLSIGWMGSKVWKAPAGRF